MIKINENWEMKIRKDYQGILSEKIIDTTVRYWGNFIKNDRRNFADKILKEVKDLFLVDYAPDDQMAVDYATLKKTINNLVNKQNENRNISGRN